MKKLMQNLLAIIALVASCTANAGESYRIAWSHYTGWEPWGYMQDHGILKKWGQKYGIDIQATLVNDYIESINLYTSGQFDACVMTNMDALTIPAVGGVDSSVIVVGDFSNGNDGIVAKGAKVMKDLKGSTVRLVELSVSHYMLARALEMNGMSERDVRITNTSDAEIASVFLTQKNGAVVTWNPPLQQVRNAKGANLLFDSSMIPGEIMDLLVIRSNAPETLKKALTGAWYETMTLMNARSKEAAAAIEAMAGQSGATVAEFKAQLKTTAMFYDPAKALEFVQSTQPTKTMEYVRTFSFDKGLFGENAPNKDFVGIGLANGDVLGNRDNIKLRFVADYMKMATEGQL